MLEFDDQKAKLATDREFAKMQIEWIFGNLAYELKWQAMEVYLSSFDEMLSKQMNGIRFGIKLKAIKFSENVQKNIEDTYLQIRGILRNPEIFEVDILNVPAASKEIVKLEKALKTQAFKNRFAKYSRSKNKRLGIKSLSTNCISKVRDRFKDRYGKLAARKFAQFVEVHILSNTNLYDFMFEGKGKPPKDYAEFKKIRGADKRNQKKNAAKDPDFEKIRTVLKKLNAQKYKRK